jgi:hypothetical protein
MGLFRDLFGLDDEPKPKPKPAPAPPPLLARPKPEAAKPEDVRGVDALKRGLGMFIGGPPKREPVSTPAPKPKPEPYRPPPQAALFSPLAKPAVDVSKPPEVAKNERMFDLINDINTTTSDPKKKAASPEDMFQMDQKKDLLGMVHDLNPKEWQLIQDNFNTGKSNSIGGELTNVPPLLARPGVTEAVPKVKAEEFSAAPLTWEAYQSMSADQKAAVDFNTMLVEAREKDLSKNWTLSPDEQEEYDKRVQKVFGQGGGSTKTAPNTMKLLATVDMNLVGQDLDQYLSLERGFTMDELEDFKLDAGAFKTLEELSVGTQETQAKGSQTMADFAAVRTPENVAAGQAALVAKTNEMAQKMMEANAVLTSFRSGVVDPFFNPEKLTAAASTGSPYAAALPEGGAPVEQWWLDLAYEHLTSPTADPNVLFEEMKSRGFGEGEALTTQNYIAQQLEQNPPGVDSRSAEEIRALLGIGG